jgi:hypothetical protein
MRSVPPRGSGWVRRIYSISLGSFPRTHPLPRGGTDLMGPIIALRARSQIGISRITIQIVKLHQPARFGHLDTVRNRVLNSSHHTINPGL